MTVAATRVSSSSRARFEARAKSARLRRFRPFLVGLVALAVLAAAGWVLLGSGVADVERVEVSGTDRMRPETVQHAAGIDIGAPLLRVDTGAVARRVRALPAVEAVTVTKKWPTGVDIRVRERTPVIAASTAGGVRLIDRRGVDFGWAPAVPRGLPTLTVPPGAPAEATLSAVNVLLVLPADLRAQVATVSAASADEVSLRLRTGATVVWGGVRDSERKAQVLGALVKRPAARYDVSSVDVATTS